LIEKAGGDRLRICQQQQGATLRLQNAPVWRLTLDAGSVRDVTVDGVPADLEPWKSSRTCGGPITASRPKTGHPCYGNDMTNSDTSSGPGGASAGPRRTYTVREAAAILGVGAPTLYRAIERGEVPFIAIGRRRLIPRVWVDQQVEKTA
jgi:excisionase family DNA binding protein